MALYICCVLDSVVLGVCDAATPTGNPPRTPRHVAQRAEELLMRMCSLGDITAVRVRTLLVSSKLCPVEPLFFYSS